MTTTWRNEFGEDWPVPEYIDKHPELADVSWHNDACPSFTALKCRNMQVDDGMPQLWVEHTDPAMQEIPIDPPENRFVVSRYFGSTGEIANVWEGSDPVEAVAQLLKLADTPLLRPAIFTMDSLAGSKFAGYTAGMTWNGWACPYFIHSVACAIIHKWNCLLAEGELDPNGPPAYYDAEKDAFIFPQFSEEEYRSFSEEFKGEMHDGLKMYAIGAFGWCWREEIEEVEG